MDALDCIFTRSSMRKFEDRPLSRAVLERILKAGVSGPCCVNAREWDFIVVEDREMLQKMADANGRPAQPLRQAAAGILICGNLSRAFPPAKDYWIIDGAIAGQNMALAAHAQGVGAVWLGVWPEMDRVKNQAELFHLPEDVVPHSVLALGWPAEQTQGHEKADFQEFTHWERW